MKLKDLPEKLQLEILRISNTYMRNHPELDIHLTKHIDQAVIDGMEFEARRHNSKAESLWQTLAAFRNMLVLLPAPKDESHLLQLSSTIALVDQCLIENKPEII